MSARRQRLQQVLTGLRFPAMRWELIAHAEAYGADAISKAELHRLPACKFRSLADVHYAVARHSDP